MTEETLPDCMARLGLTVRADFVPFSRSRNAKPDAKPSDRTLNWRVTLVHNGRDIITTDYQAGLAHCPSYKQGMRWTLENAALIEQETETGFAYRLPSFGGMRQPQKRVPAKPIEPNAADVVHCLALDSDVLNYGKFEEWADSFGYDSDSRKAESIYRACLEIALQLRNGLGESDFVALQTAAQTY